MNNLSWPLVTLASVGIGAIVGLELAALEHGMDGTVLSGCVAAIVAIVAGMGGFHVGQGIGFRKGSEEPKL